MMQASERRRRLTPAVVVPLCFLATCLVASHMRGDPPHRSQSFHVERLSAGCDGCAPDRAYVVLRFSTQVDPAAVAAAVQSTPSIVLRPRGTEASSVVLLQGDFLPSMRYRVTVPQTLRDGRGVALARAASLDFGVGQWDPVARMPTGQALLGPGRLLPIQLQHVEHARLRAVRLAPSELEAAARVAGVHQTSHDPARSLPRALRGRIRERQLAPSAAPDADDVQDVDVFALAGGAPALVILDAPGTSPIATVVQRGALSVLFKVGRTSGLAWVTDVRTGVPVGGADVTVYDGGSARFHGVTSADGILRLPSRARLEAPPRPERAAHARGHAEDDGDDEGEGDGDWEGEGEWGGGDQRALRAVAQSRGEIAFASTLFSTGLERWQFDVPQSYSEDEDSLRGMVTAERGIYRPGERVHVLGVLRKRALDGRLVPPTGDVRVRVSDPDGTAIADERVALTEFGTFRLTVPVPRGARLGHYAMSASKASGGTVSAGFEVGEYRAASFEVSLPEAAAARRERGEILVPVSAHYLYGAPVRAGNVTWSASWRPRQLALAGLERFAFTSGGGELAFLTQGELTLDRDGNGVIHIAESALPDGAGALAAQALDLVVEASVRDGGNEEITARTVQSLARDPVMVGIASERWGVAATRGWDVELVAVDPGGRPVAGRAIHTTLYRRTWVTTPEDREGRGTSYGGHYEDRAIATERVTSASAPVRAHFDTSGGGEFRLEASLTPEGGRAATEIWAWGGESYGPVRDDPRVDLRPERDAFAPGDVARIHVASPYASATALVTTERGGVMDARVVHLAGASTPIEVRIEERHLPNVLVGVALVPDGLGGETPVAGVPLRLGYTSLNVSAESRRLRVEVRPERDDARPGDEARVHVAVKDARGRPVRAEVTLWAADEGVLQLTGYRTPDPFEPAYASVGLAVDSASNLTRWTTRVPDEWDDGGIGDAGGAAAGAMRSRFLSTAFFSEGVVTGADGTAVVTVPLPDNLTRWRVMAAVADRGQAFGSGQAAIRTSKPLQVMAALPRFLTLGDRVELGAVVHNGTETAGAVDVRFEVVGAEVVGSATERLTMERGAQMPVHVTAVARELGDITVRVRVSKGSEHDGIEVKLPVQAPSMWVRQLVGDGVIDRRATTTITTPADIASGLGELRITIAPSVIASLASGLDSLVEYPNGCVEQTTSKLIPMVLLEDLVRADPRFATGEHRRRMDGAIDHVYEHQNDDGGFGLWPSSDSEGFLTAYALWGLLTAREHGYEVSSSRVTRALAYLRQHATEGDDMHGQFSTAETDPFAAYVLAYAHEQDAGLGQRLAGRSSALSRFGVGLLTTAVARRRGETGELEQVIAAARAPREGGGGALVRDPASGGGRGDFLWFGRDLRATSVAVQALTVLGKTREAGDLVSGILAEREPDGTWGSTYNNLWALYGLATYADATGRQQGAVPVSVRLGGREVANIRIDPRARVKEITVPFASLPAPGRSAELELRAAGQNVRYSATLRWVVDLAHERPTDHGLRVERELRDVDTGALVTSPRVGQVLRVRLTLVSPEAAQQVALTDRLPAGFEPIDTSLATERQRAESSGDSWTWRWREIHDERVAFFADDLSAGAHRAEYLVRVTRPGEFVRPAASAEAMYDPNVWGTGGVEHVTVR